MRSWVGLHCLNYRLALTAQAVISVEAEVTIGSAGPFDLSRYWGGPTRLEAPYALSIQHRESHVRIAVDHVSQFSSTAPMMAVPRLGQRRPKLFESAFRHSGRLFLVVTLGVLVELATGATEI